MDVVKYMQGGKGAADSMKCMHMISRDRDPSEGRGVGVNSHLERFQKFIHFGTLERPLDWYDY